MKIKFFLTLLISFILLPIAWAGNIQSYAADYDLSPIVAAYEARNRSESFDTLHSLLQVKPNKLDAYRLGMMVAASYDEHDEFFAHAANILARKPGDEHALSLKLLFSRALDNKESYQQTLQALQETSLLATEKMLSVIQEVEMLWAQPVVKRPSEIDNAKLGILALGSPANADGSPRPRLHNTLIRTLEVAKIYSQAPIIVTGGAVNSSIAEALAMKNWLVANGIESTRIIMEDKARDTVGNALNILPIIENLQINQLFLITVEYHLRRSTLIFDGVFKANKSKVLFTGVAANSDLKGKHFDQRMKIERIASYRDRCRASGLYEHDDFSVM